MLGFFGDLCTKSETRRQGDKGTRRRVSLSPRHPVSPSQKGSVSIETTFFIIICALLFFGAVELGRAISLKHSMDVGCYRAARYLSLHPYDPDTAEQMVRDEVDANILGGNYGDDVTVTIEMTGHTFGNAITVTASLDYRALVPFLSLSQVTLQTRHVNAVEKYP